jgi:hypothetical protein
VRAYFTSGNGSITFDLEKWADGEIAARSESFGSAKIKPEAFSRVVFDLATPPPSAVPQSQGVRFE